MSVCSSLRNVAVANGPPLANSSVGIDEKREIMTKYAKETTLLNSIVIAKSGEVELSPEPMPHEWITSGSPRVRKRVLSRSSDLTSALVVWDCTAGSFYWHFDVEETLLIISGEAFLQNGDGTETRFGAGDVGFFPAGTSCNWRVAEHVRKVAVLREPMWRPVGMVLKGWRKMLRTVGFTTAKAPATA